MILEQRNKGTRFIVCFMSVLREKPPMSKSKIHEMGSVLRKNGVIALDDWETYLLHQEEIVSELARKLNDFVDSKVMPGGKTTEEIIVPGSGTYKVTRRVKSVVSLKEKLRRMPKTPLERIQDVAGARLDCDVTLTQQQRIAKGLYDLFTECGANRVDIKDLRDGSHSGYRAIHLHLRFPAGFAEVQVRTALQSRWANICETAADIFGRQIRYLHEGTEVLLLPEAEINMKLLCELSTLIAQVEEMRDEHLGIGFSNVSDYDVRHSQEKISIMEDRIHIILNNLNERFRDTQRRSL